MCVNEPAMCSQQLPAPQNSYRHCSSTQRSVSRRCAQPRAAPTAPRALAAAPNSPGQGSTCIRGSPWSGHPALPVLKD